MCDCITEFQKKLIGQDFKGKKVLKAKFISAAFMMNKRDGVIEPVLQATGEIELTLSDIKKPKVINVNYSFCPFCGVKYTELKD